MICLNHEQTYQGRSIGVQKFYDICEGYYSGFVPFGRPNDLIYIADQSDRHKEILSAFIHWISCEKQNPNTKPKRPIMDSEL